MEDRCLITQEMVGREVRRVLNTLSIRYRHKLIIADRVKSMSFTDDELSLSLDDFSERRIMPAIADIRKRGHLNAS